MDRENVLQEVAVVIESARSEMEKLCWWQMGRKKSLDVKIKEAEIHLLRTLKYFSEGQKT